MKYSIVIPTYNHCDDLLKPCVESVLAYTQMDQVELIVVANGCTDNTRWYLNRLNYQFSSLGFGAHFKVIWHDQPLGFSRAVNQGIATSSGERVVLLNNDTVLLSQPHNSWLDRLSSPFVEDPQMGITGSLMLHSEETGRDFLVFFCTMIDRRVIQSVGILNEEFGVGGGEDIDYCYQAQEAGFRISCVSNSHFDPEQKRYSTDFPIYHKAEGTMHDPNLVPNWSSIFRENMQKLAQKYKNSQPPSVESLAQQFSWLKTDDPESVELFNEVFDNNVYKVDQRMLKGLTVVDIGANQGMFSLLAAGLGARQVIAAEPSADTFVRLQQNVVKSELGSRIICIKKAVTGKKSGPVALGCHSKSGHNSMYKPGNSSELVETVRLADLLALAGDDDIFLKMDCEGAEYDIVFDSEARVFDKVKQIAVEIHGDIHPFYRGVELLQAKLSSLGYTCNSSIQIGMWYYDANGDTNRFEPMPLKIDTWTRP